MSDNSVHYLNQNGFLMKKLNLDCHEFANYNVKLYRNGRHSDDFA